LIFKINVIIIAFITFSTHANTIYKCKDGEHIVFSQIPCETDNVENKQLDYPKVQNSISPESNKFRPSQNNTSPNSYLLSKKKERSLSKIKMLKQKLNIELEKIKNNGLKAGVNRAGISYLKLLNEEVVKVNDKYQKKISQEQRTLDKIEQNINILE
jgi:hypothetical protein